MKISFDGQTSPGNIITLTSVPNILTIESGTVQGSKSELVIIVSNLASLDLTKEYTITVNDVKTIGKIVYIVLQVKLLISSFILLIVIQKEIRLLQLHLLQGL